MADLQELVHESLDNAMDNGYFDEGMSLHGLSNEEIALDMIEFDAEIGDLFEADRITTADVVEHIKTWWQKL